MSLHAAVGRAVRVVRHAPAEAAREREAAEAVLGARAVLHQQAEVRLVGVAAVHRIITYVLSSTWAMSTFLGFFLAFMFPP